jgi:hypothetical protein
VSIAEHDAEQIVAVGEYRRDHLDAVTDRALDREAAAIDLGNHRVDDDSSVVDGRWSVVGGGSSSVGRRDSAVILFRVTSD